MTSDELTPRTEARGAATGEVRGDHGTRELVFRLELDAPHPATSSDSGFHLLGDARDALSKAAELRRYFGSAEYLRAVAKLATRRRLLYIVAPSGRVVHHGWLMLSHSDHFPVEDGDVVIGPIMTDPRHRGQGIAVLGLQRAMNAMFDRGHRVFYINTSEQNLPSRRAIEKVGFGDAVKIL